MQKHLHIVSGDGGIEIAPFPQIFSIQASVSGRHYWHIKVLVRRVLQILLLHVIKRRVDDVHIVNISTLHALSSS